MRLLQHNKYLNIVYYIIQGVYMKTWCLKKIIQIYFFNQNVLNWYVLKITIKRTILGLGAFLYLFKKKTQIKKVRNRLTDQQHPVHLSPERDRVR